MKLSLYEQETIILYNQAEAAAEFLDWATTDADAKKLWQEWGFELVTE